MPIHTACPNCDAEYTLADEQHGKKVRCRECKEPFVVGDEPGKRAKGEETTSRPSAVLARASSALPKRTRADEDDDEDDEDDEVRPRRKRSTRKGGSAGMVLGLAIGGVAVVLLGLGGVAVILLTDTQGPTPAPVAEAPEPPMPADAAPAPEEAAPGPADAPEVAAPAPAENAPPERTPAPAAPPPPAATTPTPSPMPAPATTPMPAPTAPAAEPASASGGQLAPAVLQRTKAASVYLRVTMLNGRIAQGSGFFGIEPGIILTNAHVLGMLEKESRLPRAVEVYLNSGESDERRLAAKVLAVDRSSDLAVLRVATVSGIDPGPLPTPLEVKSAKGLRETEAVYVFGFPFGSALGKNITVSTSAVSSLRQDENGSLVKVQVNGGMHPGNSGGPVVNAKGEVVGVAVSGIVGSQINFAVPGDHVHNIMHGRVAEMAVGQSFKQDGGIGVPVTMTLLDPLGRVQEAALDVWVGDPGKPRPATGNQPSEMPGDSGRQRIVLNYDSKEAVARADVKLPTLPAGKALWVRPTWINALKETRWDAGHVIQLKDDPVERKPILLASKYNKGARTATLSTKSGLKLRISDTKVFQLELTQDVTVGESLIPKTQGQGATLWFRYPKYATALKVDDTDEKPPLRIQAIIQYIPFMVIAQHLDKESNILKTELQPDPRIVPTIRDDLVRTHDRLQQVMEALSVPLPNKDVIPGETWKVLRDLPIHTPGAYEQGSILMSYTYLGTRKRKDKDEIVVALSGEMRGRKEQEGKLGGRVTGTALVDPATGVVTKAEAIASVDMLFLLTVDIGKIKAVAGEIQATGTLDVRLERTMK